MPDPYIVVLAALGALVLVAAWLPMLLHTAPLSLPIASVEIGATLFAVATHPAR